MCALGLDVGGRVQSGMPDRALPRSEGSKEALSMKRAMLWSLSLVVGLAATSFAQGVQTGTIRGLVKDQQDLVVPGVTVTATSPSMQGPRSTVTDATGRFALPNLPAGEYQVQFELSGFAAATQKATVLLGLAVDENVTMRAAGVSESVQVVAETPAPIATPVKGENFKHDEIEALATDRTIQGIAALAPALTTNSPNSTQLVINGSFAFDNIFMINGVDINDNLFGQPLNLFVEDAIEETQVLTSGISAEYGRFGGGVVNAITKSGSNNFSGSGRVNLYNPTWTTETPYEQANDLTHPSKLNHSLEGTFGGPIVKDRLWFFTSGRYSSNSTPLTLNVTGIQLPQDDTDKRGEIKLTGTVAPGHTISGGFLNDPRTFVNTSGLGDSFLIDPHAVVTLTYPNSYFYANYKGVLKNNLLVEAQYSQRHFEFDQTGPSGSSILDSPFFDTGFCCNYNAPYFDAGDPEARNNRQITGSATDFWDWKGRHETKGGIEWYRSQRTGGNSQSPTNYVFVSDFLTDANGNAVLDATGRPIPTFVPGTSYIQNFVPVKGAVLNVDNTSLYAQDHWSINGRWSADLGARFEHVYASSTGGITSVDSNRIVPRLAVSFDPKANGDHVIHVGYAQYSGRYNEAQIGNNSPVGTPKEIDSLYQGPVGQGYNFAPGLDPASYPVNPANVIFLSDPLQNVRQVTTLKTPLTHEFMLSYGANLMKSRGYAEVTYVARVTHNMIDDFQTLQGGFTDVVVNGVDAGTFTNIVWQNTDLAHRNYQALVFQSRYEMQKNWTLNGHLTVQLTNDGNYEGEGSNQPGYPSTIGNYPEATNAARNYPDGHLQSFQRARAVIWSVYNHDMANAGNVSVSGIWRIESGRTFSYVLRSQPPTPTQVQLIANAGYPDSALTQTYFFGDRGIGSFDGYAVIDMSINYTIPVYKSTRPFVKFDIFNLFNNEKLIAWNTGVKPDPASPVDNLGLATAYLKGAKFGTASGNTVSNGLVNNIDAFPGGSKSDYFSGSAAGGRTFRVAVGIRF
jgi:outer membrane receptor protein involved in Fe transport